MHVHPFANGNSVYDSFEGEMNVEAATNRVTTEKSNTHYELLGNTRANMLDYLVRQNWNVSNPMRICDVRPVSADHTVEDDGNLDKTNLKFYIVFNVNPSQWPR